MHQPEAESTPSKNVGSDTVGIVDMLVESKTARREEYAGSRKGARLVRSNRGVTYDRGSWYEKRKDRLEKSGEGGGVKPAGKLIVARTVGGDISRRKRCRWRRTGEQSGHRVELEEAWSLIRDDAEHGAKSCRNGVLGNAEPD
jgi:hypothetical protein